MCLFGLDMALPPHDQRHQYLRYEGLHYTDADIADFEARLAKIYMREVHRVQVFDIGGLLDLMVDGLSARMLMEHRDAQGADSARQVPDKGDLRDCWIRISFAGDFLSIAPSYTAIRNPILRLCHRLIACSIAGRSHASEKVTVTDLFYLGGMDVGSVNIFMDIDDTWAWVAMGPERQLDAAAGALGVAQDAPAIDEGRMARLEEDVHEIRGALTEQCEVIDAMVGDFSSFSTWAITSLAQMMDKEGVTYTIYSETPREYQRRRVRRRNGEANTSTAQQDQQQPDP
ncbi:hypothetical protein Tco_1440713 [Tanacetum coccineum]